MFSNDSAKSVITHLMFRGWQPIESFKSKNLLLCRATASCELRRVSPRYFIAILHSRVSVCKAETRQFQSRVEKSLSS